MTKPADPRGPIVCDFCRASRIRRRDASVLWRRRHRIISKILECQLAAPKLIIENVILVGCRKVRMIVYVLADRFRQPIREATRVRADAASRY